MSKHSNSTIKDKTTNFKVLENADDFVLFGDNNVSHPVILV